MIDLIISDEVLGLFLIFTEVVTFITVGLAGIFVNQMGLFQFYGGDAEPQLWTIGYYLYVTCNENMTKGENYIDGSSFVTHKHEKTEMYYFMRQIIQENQNFAPVILNFDYQGSKSFTWRYCYLDKQHLRYVDNSYELKKLVGIAKYNVPTYTSTDSIYYYYPFKDESREEIESILETIGFFYNSKMNQFISFK